MCTCITFINRDFYFGRNLDLEYSFGEQLVITPRRYPFFWSREGKTQEHYAMIGCTRRQSTRKAWVWPD